MENIKPTTQIVKLGELQSKCSARGIDATGNVSTLIHRLLNNDKKDREIAKAKSSAASSRASSPPTKSPPAKSPTTSNKSPQALSEAKLREIQFAKIWEDKLNGFSIATEKALSETASVKAKSSTSSSRASSPATPKVTAATSEPVTTPAVVDEQPSNIESTPASSDATPVVAQVTPTMSQATPAVVDDQSSSIIASPVTSQATPAASQASHVTPIAAQAVPTPAYQGTTGSKIRSPTLPTNTTGFGVRPVATAVKSEVKVQTSVVKPAQDIRVQPRFASQDIRIQATTTPFVPKTQVRQVVAQSSMNVKVPMAADKVQYYHKSTQAIRDECRAKGIMTSGTRKDLVSRLMNRHRSNLIIEFKRARDEHASNPASDPEALQKDILWYRLEWFTEKVQLEIGLASFSDKEASRAAFQDGRCASPRHSKIMGDKLDQLLRREWQLEMEKAK